MYRKLPDSLPLYGREMHPRRNRLDVQPVADVRGHAARARMRVGQVTGELQLSLRRLPPADLAIEGAEAEVAVGHEGAHPEFLGQRERLEVVALGLLHLSRLSVRGDLAEEA